MTEGQADSPARPRLLLFFAQAGHPHRDAACATLAWVARDEGLAFECYYEGRATGVHFGGGLPWNYDPADLRGSSFEGGRHLEQLTLTLDRFECQAACLGDTVFQPVLERAGVPIRASSPDVVEFYRQVFATGDPEQPRRVLAIGSAGPLSLVPYACGEVARKKVMAVAAGDSTTVERFAESFDVEYLWTGTESTSPADAGARIVELAQESPGDAKSFLLADPELAGRWIPSAVRNGWTPVYGIPQADVIRDLGPRLRNVDVVWGRQQDDADFLELSRLGVAFQLVDPGRPPFPVIAGADPIAPPAPCASDPSDEELRRWANSGEVVTSIVFWSGMVRELECLYALTEMVAESGLRAGLAMTTESLRYFESSPLAMLALAPERGGLRDRLEVLIASAGAGGMIESAAPPDRFAETLRRSVDSIRAIDGLKPAGWWAVMDAPLVPRPLGRVSARAWPPSLKLRYRRRPLAAAAGDGGAQGGRPSLRSRVRESPLGGLFEPIRPFDEFRPGGPQRVLLQAVRDAGFEYALTKSSFGDPPTAATGVPGLTVVNYTAGHWDGWTPFETVNRLADLPGAERRLRSSGRPGWLLAGLDTCLWAFSGHLPARGAELREICRWMAASGSSGRLRNVTPRTVARYARVLSEMGLVRTVPVR